VGPVAPPPVYCEGSTLQQQKNRAELTFYRRNVVWFIQGDQKLSVHLMITVYTKRTKILNSFNHLPW
jgi:hypothetical protein